ncbi:hypothetical protein PG999_006443 [Apiospora kogelbergensis]|uniref:Uncharacterized protein n=1 Tax=Apiospora kogelbergensis TaxID=1337665 RepID=A0AAW0QVI3_9PEZI
MSTVATLLSIFRDLLALGISKMLSRGRCRWPKNGFSYLGLGPHVDRRGRRGLVNLHDDLIHAHAHAHHVLVLVRHGVAVTHTELDRLRAPRMSM